MMLGNKTASNVNDITNMFADYFQSFYTKKDADTDNYQSKTLDEYSLGSSSLGQIGIAENDMAFEIMDLVEMTSSGPDGIPPIFIKICLKQIVKPIHILIQKSLDAGEFPTKWKYSYIKPTHKKGDKQQVKNWNPCLSLAQLQKFTTLSSKKILPHLSQIISNEEHAHIKNQSSSTNLAGLLEEGISSLNENKQLDIIYIDMSKAYDSINNDLLIYKLQKYGIHGNLLKLIKSFLKNRTQSVKIGNCISEEFTASSGIGQRTYMGSLSYVAYTNDCK